MTEPQRSELNALIRETRIKSRDGALVVEELEEALVTRDGKIAYPIRDGIPVLLEDHGIALSQLGGA
jgi:uncharacterized protein YbaR (Trm112 family)